MKEPATPDMYGKIEEESSGLGALISKIPGFGGYIERSRRREADQLLRQTISGRLEAARLQLSAVHQELSGDIILAIEHADPLGRIDTRLMGLIGKIRDAPQGYAGFFDAVKIRQEELAEIYNFDESMLAHAEQIAADIASLEKTVRDEGDIKINLRALDSAVQEANADFNRRQELLSGAS